MTWNPRLFPPVEVDSIVERACSFPAQAIVITGGEPSLYPLDYLTEQLAARGLKIFLETSGAHPLSGRFDWICLSPKSNLPADEVVFACARTKKSSSKRPTILVVAEQNAAKVTPGAALYLQPEWSRHDRMTRDRRIRQSASALEHLRADPQIHADTLTRLRMGKQQRGCKIRISQPPCRHIVLGPCDRNLRITVPDRSSPLYVSSDNARGRTLAP